MQETPLIVIVGPTASGKTKLAVSLSKALCGEVVSADSMQIYQDMRIGTAQPSCEEQEGIPHHMLAFLDPREPFSVAQYKERATDCLSDITTRGKRPVVCGGTGQYIESLLRPRDYAGAAGNDAIRAEYEALANEQGNEALVSLLKEADPVSAARIHVNDRKRLVRALEVCRVTGRPFSQHANAQAPIRRSVCIGLTMPRELLYARIEARVDAMIAEGLWNELDALRKKGISRDAPGMQALGYKELWDAADDLSLRPAAVARLKTATRQYAKRQYTWFRRYENIHWLDTTQFSFDALVAEALRLIREADEDADKEML